MALLLRFGESVAFGVDKENSKDFRVLLILALFVWYNQLFLLKSVTLLSKSPPR